MQAVKGLSWILLTRDGILRERREDACGRILADSGRICGSVAYLWAPKVQKKSWKMKYLRQSTLEKYKDLNFRVNIHLAQGPLKWPEPLYKSKTRLRSKVFSLERLGTLN